MINDFEIKICKIKYNSKEYRKELQLRDLVLRKPLGLSLYNENLEGDKDDIHIAAFEQEKLVGVLLLKPTINNEIKMRQVAVIEQYQSKKIGTKMVLFAEELAKSLGYNKMVLHARKSAIEFYRKLGYNKINTEFTEVGIPHFEMYKMLNY